MSNQPTLRYSKEQTIKRFWVKVNKDGPIPEHWPELGPCWVWTASLRNKGYGAFAYMDEFGKMIHGRAHRFSFILHGGTLKEGECALHRCDNPACVNPTHLFTGTKAENNKDMRRKGRHVPGGTHCGSAGRWPKGGKHHNAKLTEEKVRRIRKEYAAGCSYSQLAEKYGCSVTQVFKVVKRKAWRHV